MYIPSRVCWQELHSSQAGVWLDRARDGERIIVVKLPTVVLKAIQRGAGATFIVGIETVGDRPVQCLGFEVADQPVHPFITIGTNVATAEHDDLLSFLSGTTVSFIAFDELSRCVSRMRCNVAEAAAASKAHAMLKQTTPHYVGSDLKIRMDAMDRFQMNLDAAHDGRPLNTCGFERVKINVTPERTMKIAAVTFDGPGDFLLDDATEGSGLEQQVHQLLDNTFGKQLYRSPQLERDGQRRELTDVMAVSTFGTILIESKVESVFAVDPDSSPERRTKRLTGAINKALRQLGGAARRLRAGKPVYRATGEVIAIAPEELKIIQGIVLLSDTAFLAS